MSKQKRKIVIYQENVEPIHLDDEDERNDEEYAKALSSFMSLNNISILHTSTTSLILRPSKINSIQITPDVKAAIKNIPKAKSKKTPIKKENKKNEESVDIITDVD
jgi:hypothetical protein